MEKMGEWEQRNLINELTQGRELARQLQEAYLNINVPRSSSSHDQNPPELLVQKIQASYERALSMLNYCNITTTSSWLQQAAENQPPQSAVIRSVPDESPPSRSTASPRSEDSADRDFKEQDLKDASKKRKSLPRWTQLVQVTPGTDLEGPLDDGFSWRKYGQKDILGAKYPRGYYRCSHRNVQGCLATKQVQRSDDDPTIFEITYRGSHTCNLASIIPYSSGPSSDQNHEQQQQQQQDLLLSFQRGLKVVTEDLDIIRDQTFPNYPSSTSNTKVENDVVFPPPSVVGNHSPASFISPAATTSGANYFSNLMSPSSSQMNSGLQLQGNNVKFQTSDQPQLSEIIQAAAVATSATNSATVEMDFPFGNAGFDQKFIFDNNGFFS